MQVMWAASQPVRPSCSSLHLSVCKGSEASRRLTLTNHPARHAVLPLRCRPQPPPDYLLSTIVIHLSSVAKRLFFSTLVPHADSFATFFLRRTSRGTLIFLPLSSPRTHRLCKATIEHPVGEMPLRGQSIFSSAYWSPHTSSLSFDSSAYHWFIAAIANSRRR
ncbi:hypothetical protein ACRALDRAFT_213282 [Sodiomyces alcalophilus JCM 7366]|uniref:uncharacterized protein n=1 Tax=Sodiomyces alcalophilus JCM 7366 TaxID=591952 RepID=UPI0039B5AC6E